MFSLCICSNKQQNHDSTMDFVRPNTQWNHDSFVCLDKVTMEIVFPLWHSKVKKIHNGITILLYILSKTHNEINILLCHSTAKKKKMKIEKKKYQREERMWRRAQRVWEGKEKWRFGSRLRREWVGKEKGECLGRWRETQGKGMLGRWGAGKGMKKKEGKEFWIRGAKGSFHIEVRANSNGDMHGSIVTPANLWCRV